MVEIAAYAFAGICIGVIGFQIALICGAPWGHLTQGGQIHGKLPVSRRVAAFVSMFLLGAMAAAVLSAADLAPHWPEWTHWTALGIQSLSTLMNWITRSRPERMLWGPVTTIMLALVLFVVLAQ